MKTHLFLILLAAISISVDGQNLLKIRKVSFKGNRTISASKLEGELSLHAATKFGERFSDKEADRFTMPLYEENLDRIRYVYQKEGFLDVQFNEPVIKVTRNNKVKLTFNIIEGEPIVMSEIKYTVDSIKYEDFLAKKTRRKIRLQSELKVGKRFRDEWFYTDQSFISEEYNNMGYAYAKVKHKLNVDTLRRTAELNWIIDKDKLCYFGPIVMQGNERVPTKKVAKQLRFKTGDTWSKYEIDESQKQIYNLGMFRVASIKTLLSEEKPDTLPTMIVLKEAPRWSSRFGAGYGREDDFRIFVDIQYLGFITNTGRISLYAKHSGLEPYNFQLKFIQPAVIFPFNSMIINPFLMKQNEPAYRIIRNGYNLTFLQHFSEQLNTSINFYLEDVDSDTTLVEGKRSLATSSDLGFDNYSKSGISVGFIYYNGLPRLDPVTGFSLAVNVKRNGTFIEESVPFYRSLVEYKKYLGLKPGVTMALKGKIGVAKMAQNDGLVPVEERFYGGGSYSVRGWGRAQLGPKDAEGKPIGGNSLLEGSIENRYLIAPKLIFAVFCDVGNVWQDSFYYRFNDLHYAAGFSFRFKTPIGPVGLDFARPIFDTEKRWQIHFNIGNPF
ncbi:BamA/TamA family outer membrane protein [Carboxylicivirga sp. A043]|uniref:BamA/OMP85 family outer membrane protein n=1 Tax=Carboxylicivirga litoralis TaxID=2816963 RepID=UPI0021CB1B51|nr:BamA/TamA family outer membrane protein [Carboxylicivirga sp. A043]MCU4155009.1 BamA/TamA family outer membrane protein [Carboxylicivirga sp. A043]